MRPALTRKSTLAAMCSVALAVGGCSNESADSSLSSESFARVGNHIVSNKEYAEALRFETYKATMRLATWKLFDNPRPRLLTMRPPYADCVKAAHAQSPRASPARLAPLCADLVRYVRRTAGESVITAAVAAREATNDKVMPSASAVDAQWGRYLDATLGARRNLKAFIRLTGLDENFLRRDLRSSLTRTALEAHVVKANGGIAVSEAEIRAAYEKNRAQFTSPERRALHVLKAGSRRRAEAAMAAIRRGWSFGRAVEHYSDDPGNRRARGVVEPVGRGFANPVLERAVFETRTGEIAGPIAADGMFYVLRIDKRIAARTEPLDNVRAQVRQQAQQAKRQAIVRRWTASTTKRWKAQTICRKGTVDHLCGTLVTSR